MSHYRTSSRYIRLASLILLGCIGVSATSAQAQHALCEAMFKRLDQESFGRAQSGDAASMSSQATMLAHSIRNGDPETQRQAIEALLNLEIPQGLYARYRETKWNEGFETSMKALQSVVEQSQDPALRELAIQSFLAYARKISLDYQVTPEKFRNLMSAFEENVVNDPSIREDIRRTVHVDTAEFIIRTYPNPRIKPFRNDRQLAEAALAKQGEIEAEVSAAQKRHQAYGQVSDATVAETRLVQSEAGLREYALQNGFAELSKGGYWRRAIGAGLKQGDQVLVRIKIDPYAGVGSRENPYTKERIDGLSAAERDREFFIRGVVAGIAGEASVYVTLQTRDGAQQWEINSNSYKVLEVYAKSGTGKKYKKPGQLESKDPNSSTQPQRGRVRRFLDRLLN